MLYTHLAAFILCICIKYYFSLHRLPYVSGGGPAPGPVPGPGPIPGPPMPAGPMGPGPMPQPMPLMGPGPGPRPMMMPGKYYMIFDFVTRFYVV